MTHLWSKSTVPWWVLKLLTSFSKRFEHCSGICLLHRVNSLITTPLLPTWELSGSCRHDTSSNKLLTLAGKWSWCGSSTCAELFWPMVTCIPHPHGLFQHGTLVVPTCHLVLQLVQTIELQLTSSTSLMWSSPIFRTLQSTFFSLEQISWHCQASNTLAIVDPTLK